MNPDRPATSADARPAVAPRPLAPRPRLLIALLAVFALWVGFLILMNLRG